MAVAGIGMTAAFLGELVAPYQVQILTADRSLKQWRICFGIVIGYMALSWLVFLPLKFAVAAKRKMSIDIVKRKMSVGVV